MTPFRFPAKNQQQAAMAEGGRTAPAARVPSVFRRFLVRVTPAESLTAAADVSIRDKEQVNSGGETAEVGSVALDRMVLSFMEDSAAAVERPPRGRCSNCFNGGGHHDASDDEEDFDFLPSSSSSAPASGDALELLKGLVQCACAAERALLADASRIAERCGKQAGGGRRKKAEVRRAVAAGLRTLGYDAAVCRSRWDKTASHPAGEHEYIDALLLVAGPGATTTARMTRVVVEVDFRVEFEVARPTKSYRAALQALPPLFVGAPERVGKVVAVVAEAARQSLRKRGLHFPPWRKAEYMRAKWMAPHARDDDEPLALAAMPLPAAQVELRFGDTTSIAKDGDDKGEKIKEEAGKQQSPPRPKGKVVTGLASVLR